ncbi:short-chain dehydrogenase [Marivirga tractuosa]|uniref:Short-chain dehydrogenase/reductase SDR n=1 Tax=Marivirga tractuosa (strain ATCC 23168 / DSM 4126 / NBRC 15989 / NCIMB 1408 / VKM B-1430 / H-43) TaxID=643867 RepID=E4TS99_MARTH|nr:SDR family NAD(P)-dependent oxidoreductase [Marivirga tractuosa]ADR22816.1 short-chain dehydrogenase/reductase SDR [Marivirga tractuosa DSM 4126]BDD16513.1 short-chain dehydrogenase [Marivirga tractuosa]
MNILISGADGNLGSAVVQKLKSEGHKIYGLFGKKENAKNSEEGFKKELIDLTNPKAASDVVDAANKAYGEINGAVLTVGGYAGGGIKDVTIDDIHGQIKLNFDTAFNLVKPLLEKMPKGSQLFLIGAKPVLSANELKNVVSYGLAKQLVFSLADIINADFSEHGISAHVIVPSIIDTPPNREAMADMNFDDWVKPEQIAETISFYLQHPELRAGVIKAYGKM